MKTNLQRIKLLTIGNSITAYLFYERQKKEYFADLNEQNIADNKQFWRTVKPVLPYKIKLSNNTYLVEGGEIINEDD